MRRSSLALVAPLALAAGCSFSVGSNEIPAEDLERQVKAELTEMAGQSPDDVTCPDPLPAEVGAKVRCTLTAGPDKLGMTVRATKVEGSNVSFFIQVDEQMMNQ